MSRAASACRRSARACGTVDSSNLELDLRIESGSSALLSQFEQLLALFLRSRRDVDQLPRTKEIDIGLRDRAGEREPGRGEVQRAGHRRGARLADQGRLLPQKSMSQCMLAVACPIHMVVPAKGGGM